MKSTCLIPFLLLPALGCVTDGDELDGQPEQLGTTEQAVTSTIMSYHECDTVNGCFVDLGTAANGRTCFLGGIYGTLSDGSAQIYRHFSTDTYKLHLSSRWGTRIAAKAICITGGTNRANFVWTNGYAWGELPSASNPSRRCFLQSISNFNSNGFDNTSDYVHVWKSGTTWYLGGQFVGDASTAASAVCIDLPFATGIYGGVAAPGATVGGNLVDNASDGWVCGLLKLGGRFTSTSYGDGIGVGYNATTKFWNWSLVNGKQAEAVCAK